MTAFVDIHNHTLPGVDDGPKKIEDALEMARIAAADGIDTVLLTPHSHDVAGLVRGRDFLTRVEALRRDVAQAGIALTFVVGMENHLDPDLVTQIEQGIALPINNGPYILVEFPFSNILPLHADDLLFQLQLRGLMPIIAHPERCDALVLEPKVMDRYAERGILGQVTCGSIAGHFGKPYQRAAESMLKRGVVHVLATDAHMARGSRVPAMREGIAAAARIVGEQRARDMATVIPRAIVDGKPLPPSAPPRAEEKRWFGRR